jgi:hypothetical protein
MSNALPPPSALSVNENSNSTLSRAGAAANQATADYGVLSGYVSFLPTFNAVFRQICPKISRKP